MRRRKQGKQHTEVATNAAAVGRTRAAGWAAAGVLGLLAALLLASSSSAAGPKARRAATSSVIHACYNDRTGALRRVAGGGKCGHGQTSISWTVAGPAGGGGEAGTMGPMGLRGVQGVAGAAGVSVTGAQGSQGPEGPRGEAGLAGVAGATGAAGAAGQNGATGPQGPAGTPGAAGAMGPAGAPGGATGATGAAGAAGTTGDTLPAKQTETGEWSVFASAPPEAGPPKRQAGAAISFPLALETPLTGVHYLNVEETQKMAAGTLAVKGCKETAAPDNELVERPVAEPGFLCVYTSADESKFIKFTGIENSFGEGTPGTEQERASLTGAFVTFEATEKNSISNELKVQGSWAVTAG